MVCGESKEAARVRKLRADVAGIAHCARDQVQVVCSPYRVCPLGAHVDHQFGEVTGMALDRALLLGFVPRNDRRVVLQSRNFAGTLEFSMDALPPEPLGDWADYGRGAVFALLSRTDLGRGMTAIVDGHDDVGGLSSSAAVGVAYLLALEEVNGLTLSPDENIELDRVIENDYIGLNNGILDQATILLSRRDRLMRLDCHTGQRRLYSLGADAAFSIVVLFSGLRAQLCETDYNLRVSECEQASARLLEAAGIEMPPSPRFRHVPGDVFEEHSDGLPENLRRRAEHYFSEQERVRRGVELWQKGDMAGFGKLMSESGESSIRNYECGNRYLRTAYHVLRQTPGVLGARFSGAGFRGCCIALAEPDAEKEIAGQALSRYVEQHSDMANDAEVYFCRSADGAHIIRNVS